MSSVSSNKRKRPTPSTTSIEKVYFDDTWQSLLQAEWTVSQAFLKQHRMAHGKTRYFRRFEMAIRALFKAKVTTLYSVYQKVQTYETNKIANQNWSIQQDQQQHHRKSTLKQFCRDTNLMLRLDACVEPLLAELSRGFFVPLNTSLLANVARLWALVQGLQKQVQFTMDFPIETDHLISERTRFAIHKKHPTMNRAAEILSSLGIDLDWEILENAKASKKKHQSTNTPVDAIDKEENQRIEQARESSSSLTTNVDNEKASKLPSAISAASKSPLLLDDSSHDVGESVSGIFAASSKALAKSKPPPPKDNHELVKDWQQDQQKKQLKQEKDQRKRKSDGGKKDKKKKKSKKKDFFDDLFG